jgi:hypothetical protein
MAIYFFTYGDDKYKNSKIRIQQEAKASGFFDFKNIYGREDISEEFLNLTKPYIDMPRGGGYWLWKSYFLKKTFETMKENDFCVYADAGCTINPNGSQRFMDYMKMINETGVLSFRMDGLDEECYSSEAVFDELKCNTEEIRKSGQIMATILIFKKCKHSEELINEYYNLAITKTHLFSDINIFGNCERFVDFRHDQNILSVLRKKLGSTEIIDETWADSMENWQKKFYIEKIPFLATRIRN